MGLPAREVETIVLAVLEHVFAEESERRELVCQNEHANVYCALMCRTIWYSARLSLIACGTLPWPRRTHSRAFYQTSSILLQVFDCILQ